MAGGVALGDKVNGYRAQAVKPLREVRAVLPDEPVPYQVSTVKLAVRPRLMSYWIPAILGLGLMVAGMKTAGQPFVGIPQLVLGIVLVGVAAFDLITDFGLLDLRPPGRTAVLELGPGPVPAESNLRPVTSAPGAVEVGD